MSVTLTLRKFGLATILMGLSFAANAADANKVVETRWKAALQLAPQSANFCTSGEIRITNNETTGQGVLKVRFASGGEGHGSFTTTSSSFRTDNVRPLNFAAPPATVWGELRSGGAVEFSSVIGCFSKGFLEKDE